MRVFGRLLVAAVACVLTLSGCGTTEDTRPGGGLRGGWGEQAEAWVAAYDEAFDAGTGRHALFMAPDVVIDADALAERGYAVGRPPALRVQGEVYGAAVERGRVYVGASSLVRTESWMTATGTVDVLVSMTIGDDGISRCEYAVPLSSASDAGQIGVVRLLGSYVEAWGRGAGAEVDLYAPHARLTDSIRGIDVAGAGTIAALAATGGPDPRAGGDVSSDPVGWPYVHPGDGDGVLRVWAWQPGAGPCHADTVVALGLDPDGRIRNERRHHALDALASCAGLHEPDNSWWIGRDIPDPFGERLTGTIHGPAGPVQIRNGGPTWNRVVGWSLDQFARAGLPAPNVAAVTFDPLDPRCTARCAQASSTPPATVLICVDAAGLDQTPTEQPTDAVPLWPARLVLHELAHVWINQHLDTPSRQRFLEHVALTSWDDHSCAWDQRGSEWAAETIAWGLIDRVCTLPTLGAPPCAQLTESFHTLTGLQPLTACPASQAES